MIESVVESFDKIENQLHTLLKDLSNKIKAVISSFYFTLNHINNSYFIMKKIYLVFLKNIQSNYFHN